MEVTEQMNDYEQLIGLLRQVVDELDHVGVMYEGIKKLPIMDKNEMLEELTTQVSFEKIEQLKAELIAN